MEKQEGKKVEVPIEITSKGDVGGMGFTLKYDSKYLMNPVIKWGSAVGQSIPLVNTGVKGEIKATFSLGGNSLAGGQQLIGKAIFRARSVPETLETVLSLEDLSISDATGNKLGSGTDVVSGKARVVVRGLTGDNNANSRLDVGDATRIQRLLVGLDRARSWDIKANDLNGSGDLDPGDVTKVLRTVVGLDPQPKRNRGVMKMSGDKESGEKVELEVLEKTGGVLTVQVKLKEMKGEVSGANFELEYPKELLKLKDKTAYKAGEMVSKDARVIWKGMEEKDGKLAMAASSPKPWEKKDGVLAKLSFEVATGADVNKVKLGISQVEVSPDGYDNRMLAGLEMNAGSGETEEDKVEPIEAVVTLSNLSQGYDGSGKQVSVVTDPAGLNVEISYKTSAGDEVTIPTEAGEYEVVVTVKEGNYKGSASGTLKIEKSGSSGEGDKPVDVVDKDEEKKEENNTGGTTDKEESFGDVKVYANNAATVLGNVSINGEASAEGDIVAVYVGDELRAKHEVIVSNGVAWLNAQVNAAGGEETISFKVYDASSGTTYEKSGSSAVITPGATAGGYTDPLLIKMDSIAPVLTLKGEASLKIDQGTTYVDAGASATDNVDGDITSKIEITGEVNASVAGTYTLKYNVSDAAGNAAESVSRTVEVEKTTVIQKLALKSGWNLVSFYVEAEDMTPETVLSPIKDELLQIKNLTSSYDPSLPFFLNTLSSLSVNEGYWLKVNEDINLEVEGMVPAGASISVKTGWNLVGYPKESGAAPADELKSLRIRWCR